MNKRRLKEWAGGALFVLGLIGVWVAYMLIQAAYTYVWWVRLLGGIVFGAIVLWFIAKAGLALVSASKVDKAVRYTFLLGLLFFAIEIWRGQDIAAFFSPHHYYSGRDVLVRTETQQDGQGNTYQVPVAWYDPYHELHVYYLHDPHPSIWYRDLNGNWHQAHDPDPGNVHLLMLGAEVAALVIVYRVVKRRGQKLYQQTSPPVTQS